MFVIRNQGYFYTDEYFAPDGGFHRILKDTFETREAADAANGEYCRGRMRKELLSDFLFDDAEAIARVTAYLREHFPDAYDYSHEYWMHDQQPTAPKNATDAQLDQLITLSGIIFAKVFEYEKKQDEMVVDPMIAEEVYFGPEHEATLREGYEQ